MTRETPRGGKLPAILAFLTPFLALWVLQPWIPSAFPVWDYAEMLPILGSADGLVEAFARLSEFTRLEGRANYLTYLQIAATWLLAGDAPSGWQWQRAAMMLMMGLMFALAVRRFGGSWLAVGASGLLALLTVSGTEGWLFLMGEPLAAMGLLGIVLIMPLGRWPEEWRIGVLVAACALVVMLAKEIVGLALPVALVLGMMYPASRPRDGVMHLVPPRPLLVPLLLAAALGAVNVLAALSDAVPAAYAKAFQPSLGSLQRVPVLFESMLLPARFATAGHVNLLYPANLVFIALLLGAGVWLWRDETTRGIRLRFGLLLVAIPLIGATAYAFWPRYSAFYGIPFTLGGVALFAASLTLIERIGTAGRGLAWAGAILVVGFTAIASHRVAGGMRAFQDLAAGAVSILEGTVQADSILVVKAGPGGNRWPVTGPELGRYAAAIGTPGSSFPVVRDASCEEVARLLSIGAPRIGFLNDQNRCGPLPEATMTMVAVAPYLDWTTWQVRHDTLRVQILLPQSQPR